MAMTTMTTKKTLGAVAVLAVPLLLVSLYLWGPSRTPAAQPPLLTLSRSNLSEFEASFDAHTDAPRLLLLLSPT